MIMAAKNKNQRGQSFIEFAFLLPIIVGMIKLIVQVESAMSTAIVNQKYARQQLLHLNFNNRFYPERHFLEDRKTGGYKDRWWVGVDDNLNDSPDRDPVPKAPTRAVGNVNKKPDEEEGGEVATRQNVRIRITSFICTPPVSLNSGQFLSEQGIGENQYYVGNIRFCEK